MHDAQIWTLVFSLLAAINHFYAGLIGLSVAGRNRQANRLFTLLAWGGAWYALWVGLLGSGVSAPYPRLYGISQLLTGYIGPALYLFTRKMTAPAEPLGRWRWLLLAGLPGSLFAIAIFLRPEHGRELWVLYEQGRLITDGGLPGVLYLLHTLELLALLLAGLLRAARFAFGSNAGPTLRRPARSILVAAGTALIALAASNLVPQVFPHLRSLRFGPLLTIPAILILYYSLVDSRRALERLRERRQQERRRARAVLRAGRRRIRFYREQMETERARIASEIHDSVGSGLTTTIVELESGPGLSARELLARLRLALSQLRELVHLQTEEDRIELSLEFREYLTRLQKTGKLDIQHSIQDVASLSPERRYHVRQIFFELMSNVLRHSRANMVAVRFRRHGSVVSLLVADDGAGLPAGAPEAGHGLRGVQDRARRLRARFRLRSGSKGTVARLRVPMDG